MKNFFKKMLKEGGTGFTMIELLIVIAVLGVLAVAVLSAINPIEQINRGRDTGSRSDAEQLLSAIDRYYTSLEHYPWQVDGAAEEALPWTAVNLTAWTDGTTPCLTKLSTGGTAEVKAAFVTRVNSLAAPQQLRVFHHDDPGDGVYVCFQARSGSFDAEGRARCGAACAGLPGDLLEAGCDNLCPAAPTKVQICLP